MTTRYFATFFLMLAALAAPLSATIQYTYCAGGCNDNSGTGSYAAWQGAPGSAGLTFSMAPITFAAGSLLNGVYTDGTGALLTGYNGAAVDTLVSVVGTSLAQGVNGTGTGIEITLPAQTFAFGMFITSLSGGAFPTVGVGDHNSNTAAYSLSIPNGGPAQFFGIVSDTPIASLFIGSAAFSGKLEINSFELGQSAPGGETPELSSIALMGSGLVLFGLLRRRRIQKPDGSLS